MYSKKIICVIVIIVVISVLTSVTEARSYKKRIHKQENVKPKQIFDTRETNAPNFIRLLLMRFVYGIAAQMGK